MAESQTGERDQCGTGRGGEASTSATNEGGEAREQCQPPVPTTSNDSTAGSDGN